MYDRPKPTVGCSANGGGEEEEEEEEEKKQKKKKKKNKKKICAPINSVGAGQQ